MTTERTLYGAPDGTYLFVETVKYAILPVGIRIVLPSYREAKLTSMGSPATVIRHVHGSFIYLLPRRIMTSPGDKRAAVQAVFADLVGVSQQAISRYLTNETEPRLSPAGWCALVRAWHNPRIALLTLLPGQHQLSLERVTS